VWGAIVFFRTMKHCGAMETIRRWLNHLSRNRVAQAVIIGWSFQFLIEGASGFGTPAALARSLLVGLGFPALRVAVVVPVFAAVNLREAAARPDSRRQVPEIRRANADLVVGLGDGAAIVEEALDVGLLPLFTRYQEFSVGGLFQRLADCIDAEDIATGGDEIGDFPDKLLGFFPAVGDTRDLGDFARGFI
jgi:L-lactate permease